MRPDVFPAPLGVPSLTPSPRHRAVFRTVVALSVCGVPAVSASAASPATVPPVAARPAPPAEAQREVAAAMGGTRNGADLGVTALTVRTKSAPTLTLTVLDQVQSEVATDAAPANGAKPMRGRTPPRMAPGGYDFGAVETLAPARPEHVFLLRNDNPASVTMAPVQASQGGLRAAFDGSAAGKPITLQPGQKASLRVVLAPADLAAGPLAVTLWVPVTGQSAPAAVLEVFGTVRTGFHVLPSTLNFGGTGEAKASSASRSRLLTATLSPALVAAGFAPRVACSVPGAQIARVPGAAPLRTASGTARPHGARTVGATTATGDAVFTYRLTLPWQAHSFDPEGVVTVGLGPEGTHGEKDVAAALVRIIGESSPALQQEAVPLPAPPRQSAAHSHLPKP